MQITIIRSEEKVENIKDFKKADKYVAFIVPDPKKLTRKMCEELMIHAGYQLLFKEKADKLREECKNLWGKTDKKSIKRLHQIIQKEI